MVVMSMPCFHRRLFTIGSDLLPILIGCCVTVDFMMMLMLLVVVTTVAVDVGVAVDFQRQLSTVTAKLLFLLLLFLLAFQNLGGWVCQDRRRYNLQYTTQRC
jgi:hypothetical protein